MKLIQCLVPGCVRKVTPDKFELFGGRCYVCHNDDISLGEHTKVEIPKEVIPEITNPRLLPPKEEVITEKPKKQKKESKPQAVDSIPPIETSEDSLRLNVGSISLPLYTGSYLTKTLNKSYRSVKNGHLTIPVGDKYILKEDIITAIQNMIE